MHTSPYTGEVISHELDSAIRELAHVSDCVSELLNTYPQITGHSIDFRIMRAQIRVKYASDELLPWQLDSSISRQVDLGKLTLCIEKTHSDAFA